MGRKQLDLCMICDQNPCSCSSRGRSHTKRAKSDIAAPPQIRSTRRSFTDAMQSRATPAQPTRPIKVLNNKPTVSHDEEELHRAIKVLAPILHPDELDKHSSILGRDDILKRVKDLRGRDGIL